MEGQQGGTTRSRKRGAEGSGGVTRSAPFGNHCHELDVVELCGDNNSVLLSVPKGPLEAELCLGS